MVVTSQWFWAAPSTYHRLRRDRVRSQDDNSIILYIVDQHCATLWQALLIRKQFFVRNTQKELSKALDMTNLRRYQSRRMILLLNFLIFAKQQNHCHVMAFSSRTFIPNRPSSFCTICMSTEEETEVENNGKQSILRKMSGMLRVSRPALSLPKQVRYSINLGGVGQWSYKLLYDLNEMH